ncbi:hypothetical protein JCM16303_004028 [Sporobolomyces ruberrimus]
MPHLPREILFAILALAVPPSPCKDHDEWVNRQQTLSRCSLVHSTWTSFAQELLFAEHQLDSEDPHLEEKVVRGHAASGGSLKTKYLTIYTDFGEVTWIAPCELWKNVKHVVHYETETFLETDPMRYAWFTRLEVLELHWDLLTFSNFDYSPLRFSTLRRLVLNLVGTDCKFSKCQTVFSPSSMPILSHLSLNVLSDEPDDLGNAFASLLPQITVLALSNETPYNLEPAAYRGFNRLSRLAHLSINQVGDENDILGEILTSNPGLQLESLHLRASILSTTPSTLRLLVEVTKGQRENIEIAKIVLYGSKEETGALVDLSELAALEWRSGEPPFFEFDGR